MRAFWIIQVCLLLGFAASAQSQSMAAAYNNAVAAYEVKDYAAVVSLLEDEMQGDFEFIQGHRLLAESYGKLRDDANAQVFYRKVLDINPHQADVLYNLGSSYIRTGNYADAEETFQTALDIHPGYSKAEKGIKWVEQKLIAEHDKMKAKERALGDAVASMPAPYVTRKKETTEETVIESPARKTEPAAKPAAKETSPAAVSESQRKLAHNYAKKGIVYYNEKEFGDAALAFDQSLLTNPRRTMVHMFAGRAKLHLNRVDDAIAHFRKAVAKDSDNGEYHYYLAKAYEQKNEELLMQKHLKMAKARGFEGTREVFNSVATKHYNLAVEAQQRKEHTTAVKEYMRAIQVNSHLPHYHFNLAVSLVELNRIKEARNALDDALALNPGYHDAYSLLGQIYYNANSFSKAGGYYQEAINHGANKAIDYLNLAYVHEKLANHTQSVKYFKKAAELEPDNMDILLKIGLAYFGANKNSESIECFDKILKKDPNHRQALFNASSALTRVGRFEEALDYALRLTELFPNDGDTHLQAGKVYGELGDGKNKDRHMRLAKRLGAKMNDIWY
jgi:tetratricopeptide (TPR) repeat protein